MNGAFDQALDPTNRAIGDMPSPMAAANSSDSGNAMAVQTVLSGGALGGGLSGKQRRKVMRNRKAGLTPDNPQDGPTVTRWLEQDIGLS
jgi:hypothetical protein